MNRHLCFLFVSLISFTHLHATHNIGGHITYKHLSGFTYEITLTTLTEIGGAQADRPYLSLSFGDNSPIDSVLRSSQEIIYDSPGRTIKVNKYIFTHTYPGPGHYRISMEDPNRGANLSNVPNSVATIFYISADLYIPATGDPNNSAVFNGIAYHALTRNAVFRYNMAAYDPDNDHLSFSIQTPKSLNGIDQPGYTGQGMQIDPKTGELFWDSTSVTGSWLFSVQLRECRNGNLLGVVNHDFVVDVLPVETDPVFGSMNGWVKDTDSNYAVQSAPGQPVTLKISFEDQLADSIRLEAFGTPFASGAQFTDDSTGGNFIRKTFSWTPSASDHSCAPYIISFRGSSFKNGIAFPSDRTLLVNVKDPNVPCDAPCYQLVGIDESLEEAADLIVSPNPFTDFTIISAGNFRLPSHCLLTIYDLQGRMIERHRWQTTSALYIHREKMRSGIYLFDVRDNSGKPLYNGKLIAR